MQIFQGPIVELALIVFLLYYSQNILVKYILSNIFKAHFCITIYYFIVLQSKYYNKSNLQSFTDIFRLWVKMCYVRKILVKYPSVRKIDAATTHKDWRTPAFTFVKPIIPIS